MSIRAAILFAALAGTAAAQELPPVKARVAAAARADLSKLTQLERAYFSANKRYTTDLAVLKFAPSSGARISVSYASARTFSASAADVRFAPFICFVIVSSPAGGSPAEEPFCADSRFGTAATALAEAGEEPLRRAAPPASHTAATGSAATQAAAPTRAEPSTGPLTVMPVTAPGAAAPLNASEFARRLRIAAAAPHDSVTVIVQFAVNDARYDPSRGVLEVALPDVPLPVPSPAVGDSAGIRPALACFVRPAFVCGSATLSYIARTLWHLAPARAPSADEMRSGLSVRATFALGHRDDTAAPSLTLLALVLQVNGSAVSRWDHSIPH